jgi:hypothetical protein
MIAFKIVDVKDFMNKLLMGEVFNNFLLVSFEINNYVKITIDGERNKAWYQDEIMGRYVSWREIKDRISSLIKGDRVPLSIKGVFRLSEENTDKMASKLGIKGAVEQDYGLFFTLKFEKGDINIVTGVSVTDFLMSKEIGNLWDEDLLKFLKYYKIAVEIL